MPYGTVFIFMQTASAVLFQNIDTCIRIPVMNRMAFGTLPDTNAQIFLSVDFCSHNSCRSDCSDTSLVLCEFHFHTSQLYIPAFQKILPRKHSLSILTVYDSGSSPLTFRSSIQMVCFHAPASLTVSAGNHSADWFTFSYTLATLIRCFCGYRNLSERQTPLAFSVQSAWRKSGNSRSFPPFS